MFDELQGLFLSAAPCVVPFLAGCVALRWIWEWRSARQSGRPLGAHIGNGSIVVTLTTEAMIPPHPLLRKPGGTRG